MKTQTVKEVSERIFKAADLDKEKRDMLVYNLIGVLHKHKLSKSEQQAIDELIKAHRG